MKLTTQLLATFVGGQFEVQNENEGYIYRGEIKTVEVNPDDELTITFNWAAKGEGFPPREWNNETNFVYKASLSGGGMEIYSASDIGPSPQGGGNRICIQSVFIGELGVFYPPDGSKLDPAKVRGLAQ